MSPTWATIEGYMPVFLSISGRKTIPKEDLSYDSSVGNTPESRESESWVLKAIWAIHRSIIKHHYEYQTNQPGPESNSQTRDVECKEAMASREMFGKSSEP